MSNTPQHPTRWVIDSTKLQTYARCPRKFFFAYELGWQPRDQHDLIYGAIVHECLDLLYTEGLTHEVVETAMQLFNDLWQDAYGPQSEQVALLKAPKNAHCTRRMLHMYVDKYAIPDRIFEVLTTEQSGVAPLGSGYDIHYKIDAVVRNRTDGKVYVLEHKTTKSLSKQWHMQWLLKLQIGTYLHALNCLYDPAEVGGVLVNGLCIRTEPRLKLNGQPYANDKDCEFERLLIYRSPRDLENWLNEVCTHWSRLTDDYTQLDNDDQPEHNIMKSFRREPEACTDYGGCPYHTYCSAWENPLERCSNAPIGFDVRFWDPRTRVEES